MKKPKRRRPTALDRDIFTYIASLPFGTHEIRIEPYRLGDAAPKPEGGVVLRDLLGKNGRFTLTILRTAP